MEKKRVEFIDLARGFAIILVILSHINTYIDMTGSRIVEVLLSFPVTLFIMISGIFFLDKLSFKELIIRKTNRVLIPFLFFYITCSVIIPHILYFFGYHVRNEQFLGIHSLWYFVYSDKTFPNAPIWFFLSLYWINYIFYFVRKTAKNNKILILLFSFIVGVLGYTLGHFKIKFPLFMAEALTSTPYFCAGYLLKTYILDMTSYKNKNIYMLLISTALFCVAYLLSNNGPIYYCRNIFYYNIFSIWLICFCGAFSIILLAKIINKLPIISYNGRNSLIVFSTSNVVLQPVVLIMFKFNAIEHFGKTITVIAILSVIMLVYLFIVPLLQKTVPWFVAKRDLIKEK